MFNDPLISVAIFLGLDSSKTRKTQSVGRAIRQQEGKMAEIFNLVLKGTVEETWFQNSIGSNPYITLDENGLRALLEGKEFGIKKNKTVKSTFRF